MKIFVSVGTHPQPFDRLLKELDRIAASGKDIFFAQTGNSSFQPKNFKSKKFLDEGEYKARIREAGLVISHGGAGTMINALLEKKPLLVVPRLEKFGEHTNDHQLDLARAFETEGKAIALENISDLEATIERTKSFRPRLASNKDLLIAKIRDFLEKA